MGYAFGRAPKKIGTKPAPSEVDVYTGTSPEDLQRVIWSFYGHDDARLVKGCRVSDTTGMAYSVSAGVVYVPVGDTRAVLVPVDAVDRVPTEEAPASGSRTDVIYADVDGAVKVGRRLPDGCALLDRRTIAAGATSTVGSGGMKDRPFAILSGAARGIMYRWQDPTELLSHWDKTFKTRCKTTIRCDTDRHVDFRLTQSMGSDEHGSAMWEVWVDGERRFAREFDVDIRWNSAYAAYASWLLEGEHTIELRAGGQTGSKPFIYGGGGVAKQPGNRFEILDLGAAL